MGVSLDLDLYRRAFALCIVAEPHRDADEDLPCTGCLLHAARQLAIPPSHVSALASTSSSVAPPPHVEGVDGTAGGVLGPPSGQAGGPSLKSNRRERELPAAECGPAWPQNGR